MKTMVIGLNPEYSYPGTIEEWAVNNTVHHSNHGASLISRAVLKIFDGDYVSDFSDIQKLNNTYDQCILALSTHIAEKRDVTCYADVVEKLDMKVIAPSLGVKDYHESISGISELHPSVIRLLKAVSSKSEYLGCRGHYTAAVLNRNGFDNVIPIGCPTVQWKLSDTVEVTKKDKINKVAIVYHQEFAKLGRDLMSQYPILGQDFLDELIFTDRHPGDVNMRKRQERFYSGTDWGAEALRSIKRNGIFPESFDEWFAFIADQDFVITPRLHGCIAALVQGVPAVIVPRDLRMRELTEFYNIPTWSMSKLHDHSAQEIYDELDYSKLHKTLKLRYRNYLSFLDENKVSNLLERKDDFHEYTYSSEDLRVNFRLSHPKIDKSRPPGKGKVYRYLRKVLGRES